MSTNAQSFALSQQPGYGARPSYTPPSYTPPAMPTLPTLPTLAQDASLPNYAGRQIIATQLGELGNQEQASFNLARAGVKQALAGYGGWKFVGNSLTPTFDPNAGPGQREIQAMHGARDQANAGGMLESSFANQNIASAAQRVSLEAQQIVSQYASQINSIATSYAQAGASLVGQFASLYGQDAAWAVDHPPPTPPQNVEQPPQPAGTAPTPTGHANQAPVGVNQAAMSPGFRVLDTGNVLTSYTRSDLTPANRAKLLRQFPGYTIAISGTGAVVMKKAA